MAPKVTFYKLAPGTPSNFFDASQKKHKKLLVGQVLPMDRTPKLIKTLKAGGIELAEKEEREEYLAKLAKMPKPTVQKKTKEHQRTDTELSITKENLGKTTDALNNAVEENDLLKTQIQELTDAAAKKAEKPEPSK